MMKQKKIFPFSIILVVVAFSSTSLPVNAEENISGPAYQSDQASLTPIPSREELKRKMERRRTEAPFKEGIDSKPNNFPEYYPEKFDVIGVVYEVNRSKGYIDVLAHHYPLAPSVRYYTQESKINSLSNIKHGTIVGMVLDSKKRVKAVYEVPRSMYIPN